MKFYDVLQIAIVGGALVFSALYALGRVAPGLRKRCGNWLARPQQPRLLRHVGAKLAGGSGGCGDGCDTCGSCGPADKGARARKISVNQL